MTPDEFRHMGHQVIDWIADYRATIEARPVQPRVEPGVLKKQLPSDPPQEPQPFTDVLRDVEDLILPALALAGGGLQTGGKPLVVYCSEQAHSSVDKAALLAGFGRAYVRKIEVDPYYAMRPEALSVAIEADIAQGRVPCAVVATTGT